MDALPSEPALEFSGPHLPHLLKMDPVGRPGLGVLDWAFREQRIDASLSIWPFLGL